MPSEMRYGEFKRMVEQAGWRFSRTNGSHNIFKLPVHHNQVKPFYVREARKIIKGN